MFIALVVVGLLLWLCYRGLVHYVREADGTTQFAIAYGSHWTQHAFLAVMILGAFDVAGFVCAAVWYLYKVFQ